AGVGRPTARASPCPLRVPESNMADPSPPQSLDPRAAAQPGGRGEPPAPGHGGSATSPELTAEEVRLAEDRAGLAPWKRWGPYVSERAWGTVREDYSPDGDAWASFPHDHARSRAYRWGEDGLAGLCDRYQLLVLALALWNGRDP